MPVARQRRLSQFSAILLGFPYVCNEERVADRLKFKEVWAGRISIEAQKSLALHPSQASTPSSCRASESPSMLLPKRPLGHRVRAFLLPRSHRARPNQLPTCRELSDRRVRPPHPTREPQPSRQGLLCLY